jgi:hypothetical protein
MAWKASVTTPGPFFVFDPGQSDLPGCFIKSCMTKELTMQENYEELVRLARMYGYQARFAETSQFAAELRAKAKKHQRMAAQLDGGKLPEIGE